MSTPSQEVFKVRSSGAPPSSVQMGICSFLATRKVVGGPSRGGEGAGRETESPPPHSSPILPWVGAGVGV